MKRLVTLFLVGFVFSNLFASGFVTMKMKPVAKISDTIRIYKHEEANKFQTGQIIRFLKKQDNLNDDLLRTAIFTATKGNGGDLGLLEQIQGFFANPDGADAAFDIVIGQNEEQANEMKADCIRPDLCYPVSIEKVFGYSDACQIGDSKFDDILESIINGYKNLANNGKMLNKDIKKRLLEEYCSFLVTG